MTPPKPACSDLLRWLRLNFGRSVLGALTGTDAKALAAASHIIELYAYGRSDAALSAFHDVVTCMQPSTREFAYHAIAKTMDWPDRELVWALAGLPPLTSVMRAAGESKVGW
jgi:hypothetical protein